MAVDNSKNEDEIENVEKEKAIFSGFDKRGILWLFKSGAIYRDSCLKYFTKIRPDRYIELEKFVKNIKGPLSDKLAKRMEELKPNNYSELPEEGAEKMEELKPNNYSELPEEGAEKKEKIIPMAEDQIFAGYDSLDIRWLINHGVFNKESTLKYFTKIRPDRFFELYEYVKSRGGIVPEIVLKRMEQCRTQLDVGKLVEIQKEKVKELKYDLMDEIYSAYEKLEDEETDDHEKIVEIRNTLREMFHRIHEST